MDYRVKEITANFNITYPICNSKRRNQALILCQGADGKFILAGKQGYYPDGFCRLLGGGMNGKEDGMVAAARELNEETGVKVKPDQLRPIALIHSDTYTNEGEITLNTHLFFCKFDEGTSMKASDDVSDLKHLTLKELQDLIERMGYMEGEYVGVTKGKTVIMSWADWGKVYQQVHKTALDWYLNLDANSL